MGQRLSALVRSFRKSAPASGGVLLAVRLLLGAMMQTASGVRGTTALRNSVLRSDAHAPGVDMTPKESLPSGIGTIPSAMERRWDAPTIRTNWKENQRNFFRMKITNQSSEQIFCNIYIL